MFHSKPHFYSTGSDYCIVAIGKPKWQVCKASHSVSKQQQRLLYYCLFAPRGCYSSRTSRSWWITYSMQRQRRGCNNIPSLSQQTTPIIHSFLQSLLLARPSHPGHSTIWSPCFFFGHFLVIDQILFLMTEKNLVTMSEKVGKWILFWQGLIYTITGQMTETSQLKKNGLFLFNFPVCTN